MNGLLINDMHTPGIIYLYRKYNIHVAHLDTTEITWDATERTHVSPTPCLHITLKVQEYGHVKSNTWVIKSGSATKGHCPRISLVRYKGYNLCPPGVEVR